MGELTPEHREKDFKKFLCMQWLTGTLSVGLK